MIQKTNKIIRLSALFFSFVCSSPAQIVDEEKVNINDKTSLKAINPTDTIQLPQKIMINCGCRNNKNYPPPLYFIGKKEISIEKLKEIDLESIKSLFVIRGEKAVRKYGKRAEGGVIVLKIKKQKIAKKQTPAISN